MWWYRLYGYTKLLKFFFSENFFFSIWSYRKKTSFQKKIFKNFTHGCVTFFSLKKIFHFLWKIVVVENDEKYTFFPKSDFWREILFDEFSFFFNSLWKKVHQEKILGENHAQSSWPGRNTHFKQNVLFLGHEHTDLYSS